MIWRPNDLVSRIDVIQIDFNVDLFYVVAEVRNFDLYQIPFGLCYVVNWKNIAIKQIIILKNILRGYNFILETCEENIIKKKKSLEYFHSREPWVLHKYYFHHNNSVQNLILLNIWWESLGFVPCIKLFDPQIISWVIWMYHKIDLIAALCCVVPIVR